MIQIILIVQSKAQAKSIIDELTLEKLIMDVFIHSEEESLGARTKVTGITRAVLYPNIENVLKKRQDEEKVKLYSIPIVNMDWNDSQLLLNQKSKT